MISILGPKDIERNTNRRFEHTSVQSRDIENNEVF